jgi:hypothetical protein
MGRCVATADSQPMAPPRPDEGELLEDSQQLRPCGCYGTLSLPADLEAPWERVTPAPPRKLACAAALLVRYLTYLRSSAEAQPGACFRNAASRIYFPLEVY